MGREIAMGCCACAMVIVGAWAFEHGGWSVVLWGCAGVLATSALDGLRRG